MDFLLEYIYRIFFPYQEEILLFIIIEEDNTILNIINEHAPEEEAENPEEICPICRDIFGDKLIRTLPCNHSFCSTCIVPWLSNHVNTCPTCRTQFP